MLNKDPNLMEISDFFIRNRKQCAKAMNMFSLFSNETRFKILCVLLEKDFCVNEITELVGGKHSNVSQQLKILSLAGYLSKERQERSIIYHLADRRIESIVRYIKKQFAENPHKDGE